jgi:hypothetical protein
LFDIRSLKFGKISSVLTGFIGSADSHSTEGVFILDGIIGPLDVYNINENFTDIFSLNFSYFSSSCKISSGIRLVSMSGVKYI